MNFTWVIINKQYTKFNLFNKLIDFYLFNNIFYFYIDKKFKNTTSKLFLLNNKLVTFSFFNGKKLTNMIVFFKLFYWIYKILFINNESIKIDFYKYFKEFLFNFQFNKNLNNLNYILNWLFVWIQPMFFIECSTIPKKYRKKLKKKYLYKVTYLNLIKRQNKAINWIISYSNTLKNYSFKNRQLVVFLDLLFNYKYSYIYKKKLLIYKKIFKI